MQRTVVVVVSLLLIVSPAEGEPQVIGPPQPIVAAPGDDVILPCYLEPQFNVEGWTVEWSKPDLKPDPSDRLSRVGYVHLYRDRRENVDMKIPSYARRTKLSTDELKRGDISLTILNVTLEDAGRYRCYIPKLRSEVKYSIVELVVDPNFAKTGTTEAPLHPRGGVNPDEEDKADINGRQTSTTFWVLVLVIALLTILGLSFSGYCYVRWRQKQNVEKEAIETKHLPV